jgi:8-amino-7-oxononanoate synthase
MAADPLRWVDDELAALDTAGLRRRRTVREGPQGAGPIHWNGRDLVNFGSNDYLGLAAAEVRDAVLLTIERAGWGSGASPLVTGRGAVHEALEQALARFEGTQAALLFSSGYAANLSTITALVGKGDAVYLDAKNHASIIDGCRLSGARMEVYPHGDATFLQRRLARRDDFRRRLIVTDSLFSMDGDFAPLAELAELAERYDAMLMVDEAHATGVFGRLGRGVCEESGVERGVHIRVGTLSKALGSMGGFVAGSAALIDWLVNRARSYIFSTAPPEALAAAALKALDVVLGDPHRRTLLRQRAAMLRAGLQRQGWNTGRSNSQIVPVILGDPQRTMDFSRALQDHGLFVPGIRPPAVPPGECLLRISLSYLHSDEDVQRLLDALAQQADRPPG